MIKTIAIDLGGVYFTKGTEVFVEKIHKSLKLPKQKIAEIFEGSQMKEGYLYRKGKLTKNQFWKLAIKKLNLSQEDIPKLQKLWHSSYKLNKSISNLTNKLRKHYLVVAFSNTIKERVDYLEKKYHFKENFDALFFSYIYKLTKFEKKFYKILLEKTHSKPGECLYIDDKLYNLKLAKSLGINTIWFKNLAQLIKELKKRNIIKAQDL